MTPSEAAVEVQIASDDDIDVAIGRALSSAGATLEQLRDQARRSRFASERARTAWFVISPLVANR
jgi:hypothetical protein